MEFLGHSPIEIKTELIDALSREETELLAIGLQLEPYIDDPILDEDQFDQLLLFQEKGSGRTITWNSHTVQQLETRSKRRQKAKKNGNC